MMAQQPQPGPVANGRSQPRTILYTGKGGVGKTTVAAATARRCAAQGLRTIIVSTDPAHSLSDCFEADLGHEPSRLDDRLWGQEIQAQTELEARWGAVRKWLGELLAEVGIKGIAAEELTVPPGLDELFSLLEIRNLHRCGRYDAIVVDCAPTGETLRLLSFPDACRWWLERVVPWERRLLSAARPIARGMLDVPLPSEDAMAQVQAVVRELVEMNTILRDREHSSIRLVMNPDRMVVRESQRTFTYLNLYGYLTDAVIVNKMFPDEVAGTYFGPWRERQAEILDQVHSGFAPVPVLTATYSDHEVIGNRALDAFGDELFADREAPALLHNEPPHQLTSEGGQTVLLVKVPFASRDRLSLKRIGEELVVTAGDQKRTIILPAALSAHRPSSAGLEDGVLKISFDDGRSPAAERPNPSGDGVPTVVPDLPRRRGVHGRTRG